MSQPPPPPRRTATPTPSSSGSSSQPAAKSGWKAKASVWGKVAVAKGTILSDRVGVKVNKLSANMGSEAFWPVTGDFPAEMDKAARILRAFTVDAPEETIEVEPVKGIKKQQKVIKRIPPKIIRDAKGLAIFTSMRTGMAPFGGAGGAGVVVAKLPDGSWSAPSSMSPNNLSAGFMLGIDIYDAVLIIRTQAALDSFSGHKVTLGTELGVAAGPYGAGAAMEAGIEKSPVLSYIRSRGAYAGVEAVGQIFVIRKEENEIQYSWPGVTSGDILQGKVRVPREAALLMQALWDAEGRRADSDVAGRPSEPGPSYSSGYPTPIIPSRPTSEYPPEKQQGPQVPSPERCEAEVATERYKEETPGERYERETAEAPEEVEEGAGSSGGPPVIPPRVDSGISLSGLRLQEGGPEGYEEEGPVGVQLPPYSVEQREGAAVPVEKQEYRPE